MTSPPTTPTPTEAFDWLYRQFRAYTRNELIWLDVRKVFAQAEALRVLFNMPVVDPRYSPTLLAGDDGTLRPATTTPAAAPDDPETPPAA